MAKFKKNSKRRVATPSHLKRNGQNVTSHKLVPKNINSYLSKRYYDVMQPASFTSVYKLFNTIKHEGVYDVSLDRVKKWAMGQDALTMNKRPSYKSKIRRKVVSGLTWSLFDADLLVLNQERFKSANSNHAYILVCVDVLSSFARVAAIKTKGSQDVLDGFKRIFEKEGKYPSSIRSDRGNEFSNQLLANYMKAHNINHYFAAGTSFKANYSEVFIRTLKSRLFKLFQHRNSYKYIDVLQSMVESYNNTYNSSIKMTPAEVNGNNEQEIWFKKYFPPKAYKNAFKKAAKLQRRRKHHHDNDSPFKYAIGAHVRVTYLREQFARDYDISYSGEIYTIYDRRISQGQPIYYLKDYNKVKLTETFYQWELQEIDFNPKQTFKIEKIVKKRTRNGVKESLVKYQFWPASYNEWIPDKKLISLKQ
jgi:hypothetical protein